MAQLQQAAYQWPLTYQYDQPFAVQKLMVELINNYFPDLLELFEMKGPFKSRTLEGPNFLVIEMSSNLGALIPTCGTLPLVEIQRKLETLPKSRISLEDVSKIFEVSFQKCVFVSHVVNGHASWQSIHAQVLDWLNIHAIPRIEKLNFKRVQRALPEAKSYDPQKIFEHLVILEDEVNMIQGSAFRINEGIFVTCAHSLATDSKAIFPKAPSTKLDIEVICSNRDIDLAIFSIFETEKKVGLSIGNSDSIIQLSQICVAGFPNYHCGDQGVLVPGNITGFRTISGIRRMLTNASIVAGTSGGPVLNAKSEVIGVAVTGSDFQENADQTEKHGIIPIEALRFLQKKSKVV